MAELWGHNDEESVIQIEVKFLPPHRFGLPLGSHSKIERVSEHYGRLKYELVFFHRNVETVYDLAVHDGLPVVIQTRALASPR